MTLFVTDFVSGTPLPFGPLRGRWTVSDCVPPACAMPPVITELQRADTMATTLSHNTAMLAGGSVPV